MQYNKFLVAKYWKSNLPLAKWINFDVFVCNLKIIDKTICCYGRWIIYTVFGLLGPNPNVCVGGFSTPPSNALIILWTPRGCPIIQLNSDIIYWAILYDPSG